MVTQLFSVSPGEVMPHSLALCDDSFISSAQVLVDALHECGTRVAVQLMHPGMLLLLLRSLPEGTTVKVPSLTPRMTGGHPYEEIGRDRIEAYVRDFSLAARRVREAGADAVELHACHGCLVSTFLSPATNRRTDRYGGTVENRTRFAAGIVAGMREAVGPDFAVMVRINGSDGVPGGVSRAEVVEQAGILAAAGADAVGISSGLEYWSSLMAPCSLTPDGPAVGLAEAVRRSVNVPVIVAGKIPPEKAPVLVQAGKADFVALGRPFLADPGLAGKLRAGEDGAAGKIRPCLYCNNCMRSRWRSCTVNPFLYREQKAEAFEAPELQRADSPREIAVVGGGPAGMQAASLLDRRGHRVTLYERESELGGAWRLACRLPGRERYRLLLRHLERGLADGRVDVKPGVEIGLPALSESAPDVVILATGATPRRPDIPGVDRRSVVQACGVIAGRSPVESPAVVIGSDTVAMETALLLARGGIRVSLVSPGRLGGRRGPEERITFRALMERVPDAGIPLLEERKVLEIAAEGAVVEREGEPYLVPGRTVVLAVGFAPDDRLAAELESSSFETYSVGDCVQPGTAAQATFAAASLALRL